MSDFFASLAQTALGSARVVQPRLASRFESVADGANDIEMTASSPAYVKPLPLERHDLLSSRHRKERAEIPSLPVQTNLAFQKPSTEHLIEHETNTMIARDTQSSPLLASPTQPRVLEQDLLPTRPVIIQDDRAKTQSPLTLTEPQEKETLHTHHHTLETVTRENLLPVVQREVSNLEIPETPLLQTALAPSVLKPEVTTAQTPTVQVTIGRLEIRTPPQQKTVPQANKPTGVMSLEDYRRKRGLE